MNIVMLAVTGLVVVFNLVLAFFVFRANKAPAYRFFSLFVVGICVWIVCNHLATSVTRPELALFFVRIVMVNTSILIAVLYCFTITFPNHKFTLAPEKRVLVSISALICAGLSLTPLVFSAAEISDTGLKLTIGKGMGIFAVYVIFFLFIITYRFWQGAKNAVGLVRMRTRLLLVSFIAALVSVFFFNFVMVVIFGINAYVNVGTWLMSFLISSGVGYALLKTRFVSLDFLLARGIYFTSLIILLVVAYYDFAFLYRLGNTFVIYLGLPLFVIWLWFFVQTYNRFEQFLIKRIVNHGADWHSEQKQFLEQIVAEMDYVTIIQKTVAFFNRLIKCEGSMLAGAFMESSDQVVSWGNLEKVKKPKDLLSVCKKMWEKNPQQILVAEELAGDADSRLVSKALKENEVEVAFPVLIFGNLKGALFLGEKINRDPYYLLDFGLVEQILQEVAPLINQATIYQESQDFAGVLQRRINRATAKLVKTNEKLVIADQLKDEFVSVASHELRTPMTAIKNYLWLVAKNNRPEKIDENNRYLQIAISSTDRLLSLVNDMLTISRMEGNRFALKLEKHDLSSLVSSTIDDLLPLAKEKRIELKTEFGKRQILVTVDRDKVLEVLHNIIGNGLKFTKVGGVTIVAKKREGEVLLQVKDTGSGIPAEDHDKLFRKFSRVEKSYVKLKETGTGLGLYISREIMRRHGGDITMVSHEGKGSIFTIHFRG